MSVSVRQLVPAFLVAAPLWLGCPDKPAEISTSQLTVDAGSREPARPESLELVVRGSVPGGDTVEIALDPTDRVEIPPVQALRLQGNLPLRNYRVRIFDEADRALVSDDTARELEDGFEYVVSFPEPLRTGYRYVLTIDAETGAELQDAWGRTHPDFRREFVIQGERVPVQAPSSPKKRRR